MSYVAVKSICILALVTKLVTDFLDGSGIMALAGAHDLTLEVVQHPFVCNTVIRRFLPDNNNDLDK